MRRVGIWSEHTYAWGMRPVDQVLEAVEALPDDLTNEEVVALFAVTDRLTARLSEALHRIDPLDDGAVTLPQPEREPSWLFRPAALRTEPRIVGWESE